MNHGRRRNLAGVLIVAVSVAGVVAAFAAVGNGSREPSSASAVTPVSFSLQGLDGDEVSAAQLRGSVTVLAFVQAGCASCAYTLHELAAASGPDIRTLAVGFPSSGAELSRFVRALGVSAPNLQYLSDPDGSAARALGVNAIDTVVVLDAGGRVRWRGLSPAQDLIAAQATSAA
jgi:peroxiredoxin